MYKCKKCGKTREHKFSCDCDETDDLIETVVDIISIGIGVSNLLSDNDDSSSSSDFISGDSIDDSIFNGFGGGDFGGGGAGDDW